MRPSSTSLRVAVADDDPEILEFLQDVVQGLGHQVTATCSNGDELVQSCLAAPPELIITDVKMPGMDGIEAVVVITRPKSIPTIVVTSYFEPEIVERALGSTVMAYLTKPVKPNDLEVAIPLTMRRFREFQATRDHADVLQQELVDRKDVERAKGILMERARLGEAEAHKRLRRMATEQGLKTPVTARMIIALDKEFSSSTARNRSS
jgi:two-component system, response regulator PdtaR